MNYSSDSLMIRAMIYFFCFLICKAQKRIAQQTAQPRSNKLLITFSESKIIILMLENIPIAEHILPTSIPVTLTFPHSFSFPSMTTCPFSSNNGVIPVSVQPLPAI